MNDHDFHRAGALTAALLALLPAATAQTAGADLLEPLPGAPYGVTGRAVGDYNGDLIPDLATVWSGRPTVVLSADLFANGFPISTRAAADVATFPGAGPFGDGVLAAGPDGLHLYTQDEGSPAFVEQTIDGSAWRGVTSIAAGDVDGDGDLDVLGNGAAGLLRLEQKLGGFEVHPTIAVAGGVRRIGLLDYDGDASLEVFLVRDHQVEVVDLAGAPRLVVNETEVEDAVPVRHVADEAAGKQRLAVLFESYAPTSNRWLRVYGAAGTSVGTPLGITLSARLGAANLLPETAPGHRDDLVVSHGGHVLQFGLLNLSTSNPTSEPFSNTTGHGTELATWGTPMTPMTSAPFLHDFDLDGDPDWLQHFEGIAKLWLDRNPEVNEELRKVYPANEPSYITDEDVLTLRFDLPADGLAGATHVEFVVYHRGLDAFGALLPYASSNPDVLYVETAAAVNGTISLDLPLYETTYPNQAEYYLVARELVIDAGTGAYLASGVPGLSIWSAENARYLQLSQQYEATTLSTGSASATDGPPKSGGVQSGGGTASNIPICPFDPNMIPDPPRGSTETPPAGGGD